MSAWHTRTYTEPATGEIVARYAIGVSPKKLVSLDGELWMQALTDDDVVKREESRRSVRSAVPQADQSERPASD